MAATSKAAFVRSLPPSMSAKDVIAKAKEKGIKLTPAYVYVIRSKSGGAKAAKGGGKATASKSNGSLEKQFVSLALDLGFSRAQALLDDVRSRVQRSL